MASPPSGTYPSAFRSSFFPFAYFPNQFRNQTSKTNQSKTKTFGGLLDLPLYAEQESGTETETKHSVFKLSQRGLETATQSLCI